MQRKKNAQNIVLCLVMCFFSLIVLIPVALLIITAFKTTKESQIISFVLPEHWQWENIKIVWERGLLWQGFLNSVIITVPCVILIVITSAMMSYYLARRKTRFSYGMYTFTVMGLIKPIPLVTTFLLLQQMHLLNKHVGVILVLAATLISLASFTYTGFIKGIPQELDDAASIDGCSPFQTFWKVVFPLLKPCTFTVVILMVLNVWNDGQAALFFLGNSDYWTLPLTIYRFSGYFRNEWNYIFCAILLSSLPVFLVYLFGQRYIIDGMVSGSVKG